MIEITQLRIGNYVGYEQTTHVVTGITGIKQDMIYSTGLVNPMPVFDLARNYEPIKLNEDWLVKLGFDKVGASKILSTYEKRWFVHRDTHFKEISISIEMGSMYLWLREGSINEPRDYDDIVTLWNMDLLDNFYVHQLQNLFHNLTGQELTINA